MGWKEVLVELLKEDKVLAMVAAVCICFLAIWVPENVVQVALSGIFGMAVGRSTK